MKKEFVPQDENPLLEGKRKAIYALNEEGHYAVVPSTGWSVEETVTSLYLKEYEDQRNEALARVRAGMSSPLEYHMYDKRMDEQLLAQCSGFFRFQVRRHFKPSIFNSLSDKKLQRYADIFSIDIETLKTVPSV